MCIHLLSGFYCTTMLRVSGCRTAHRVSAVQQWTGLLLHCSKQGTCNRSPSQRGSHHPPFTSRAESVHACGGCCSENSSGRSASSFLISSLYDTTSSMTAPGGGAHTCCTSPTTNIRDYPPRTDRKVIDELNTAIAMRARSPTAEEVALLRQEYG